MPALQPDAPSATGAADTVPALLRPVARASDGALPAGVELLALGLAHRGAEFVVQRPLARELRLTAPEAGGKPRQIRGAQRGRLRDLRALHRHAQDISLELHQQVVY